MPAIQKNDKKMEAFFIGLFAVLCSFFQLKFDSDTYWILNSGKYVLANGIPHIEPFTIHEGLNFVMQQWLTAGIFAFIYQHFGTVFLFLLVYIVYLSIVLVIYRFCMMVSGNNMPVSFLTTVLTIPGLYLFMVLRPSLFSILIFAIELFLIEKSVRSGNIKLLLTLPFLSILLINLHAAMWPFFFIVYLPYFGELLADKLIRKADSKIHGLWICISAVASLLVGFINPYDIQAMTYLFRSYGHEYISKLVSEMNPIPFFTVNGIYFFIVLSALLITLAIRLKNEIRLRYLFFALGTIFLALTAARNLGLFCVCGIPMLAFALQDFRWKGDVSSETPKLRVALMAIFIVVILLTQTVRVMDAIKWVDPVAPQNAVTYLQNHENISAMRLYTDYNIGGFVEFKGLKPFMDARAEVFLKINNDQADIFDDYVHLRSGSLYYGDFISKYKLSHFLLAKGDLLDTYLAKDSGYKAIYEDDAFIIYKKK